MGYYKLNTDSTIQSANTQIADDWKPLSELQAKEDGSYYTFYGIDGTPDLAKEQSLAEANLGTLCFRKLAFG